MKHGIPATLNLRGVVGPEAPVSADGYQAVVPFAFHLIPPIAKFALAEVLMQGALARGVDTWRTIPMVEHLNHAEQHQTAFLAGDTSEGPAFVHLVHALARLCFAVELAIQQHIAEEAKDGNGQATER